MEDVKSMETMMEEDETQRPVNGSITLNNATISSKYHSYFQTIQITVSCILFVAIMVLNSSLIRALLCPNIRKTRMNFFILHLAIADLCVGVLCVPDVLQKLHIIQLSGAGMCKCVKFLQAAVLYGSSYVLVALSVDRCDAIKNPMNFLRSWTRARVMIFGAWGVSAIASLPTLFIYDVKKFHGTPQCWIDLKTPQKWQLWITSISIMQFVVPALLITVCNLEIVLITRRRSKDVLMRPPGHNDSSRASSMGHTPRAITKSLIMTFVIVIVYICCWLPYAVFNMLVVFHPMTQTISAVATLIQSFAPLNSVANPLICGIFSPHIYAGLRKVIPYKWLWCPRRSFTANTDPTHASPSHSSAAAILNHPDSISPRHDGRRNQHLRLQARPPDASDSMPGVPNNTQDTRF